MAIMRTQMYFSWEGATAWGTIRAPMKKLIHRKSQQKGPRLAAVRVSCTPSRATKAATSSSTAR